MSSEALEAIRRRHAAPTSGPWDNALRGSISGYMEQARLDVLALLAELARLEQERNEAERESSAQMGAKREAQMALGAITEGLDLRLADLGNGWTEGAVKILARIETIVDEGERGFAALAVARKREQRLREAAQPLVNYCDNTGPRTHSPGMPPYFTVAADLVDALRAALVDEPAADEVQANAKERQTLGAATLAEPEVSPEAAMTSGSASAAARDRLVASTIDAGPLPRPSDVAELLAAEVAMREQAVETLRNLHDNWRQIVEAQDVDGGPLIENILYWLIEDLKPDAALSEPGSPAGKGLGRPGSASAAADEPGETPA